MPGRYTLVREPSNYRIAHPDRADYCYTDIKFMKATPHNPLKDFVDSPGYCSVVRVYWSEGHGVL